MLRSSILLPAFVVLVGLVGLAHAAAPGSPSAAPVRPAMEESSSTGPVGPVTCSAHSDCASCASDTNCEYCAYFGESQGSGACYNRSEYGSCPSYLGTTIEYSGACALPGDQCSNYYQSCSTCANAPLSLNCGYCADTQTCSSGSPTMPNSGSCLTQSYGFQSASCSSQQATCNAWNGYGCSECLSVSGCGYCSTTGRCELAYSIGGAPLSGDCPTTDFTSIASQCTGATDPCSSYSNGPCDTCTQSTPSAWSCGYCATTQTCQSGLSNGPFKGSCPTNQWSAPGQYCTTPAPVYDCSQYSYSCTECTSQGGNCAFCANPDGTGTCMAPNTYCSTGVLESYSYQCTAPTPTPGPTPSPDYNDGAFPDAGTAAVVLLGVTSIFMLIRLVLYLCSARWQPVFGTRLIAGQPSRHDYSGTLRVLPLVLAFLALGMKLSALALDTWDYDSEAGLEIHIGVLGITTTNSLGGDSNWISYVDYCSAMSSVSDNWFAMCNIMRAAGMLVLISGSLASLSTLMVLVFSVYTLCRRDALPSSLLKVWRWSGLSSLFTLAASSYWGWSGHMVWHHMDGSATLGVSWILMISSWVFDLLLRFYFRSAIRHTIDPARAAVPAAFLAYAPLSSGPGLQQPLVQAVPVQQQQQAYYSQQQYTPYYPPPQQQQQPLAYQPQGAQRYQPNVAYATPIYGSGAQQA